VALRKRPCRGVSPVNHESGAGKEISEKPFDPNEAEIQIDVIFAKTFDPPVVPGSLFEGQQAVKILFDHYVAEIDRNRPHEVEFLLVPERAGDVADTILQGVAGAHLIACPAGATMNRVEVSGYGMPVIAKGTDYDMDAENPPGARSSGGNRLEQIFDLRFIHGLACRFSSD